MRGLGKNILRPAAAALALSTIPALAGAQEEESWLIQNARIHARRGSGPHRVGFDPGSGRADR